MKLESWKERRQIGVGKIFGEIMAENFPAWWQILTHRLKNPNNKPKQWYAKKNTLGLMIIVINQR